MAQAWILYFTYCKVHPDVPCTSHQTQRPLFWYSSKDKSNQELSQGMRTVASGSCCRALFFSFLSFGSAQTWASLKFAQDPTGNRERTRHLLVNLGRDSSLKMATIHSFLEVHAVLLIKRWGLLPFPTNPGCPVTCLDPESTAEGTLYQRPANFCFLLLSLEEGSYHS